MHLRVWKELANVSESRWQSEAVPNYLEKANVTPTFKKCKKNASGNYRLVSLYLSPREGCGTTPTGTISNHMKDKKWICNSQYGFANISCEQMVSELLDCLL